MTIFKQRPIYLTYDYTIFILTNFKTFFKNSCVEFKRTKKDFLTYEDTWFLKQNGKHKGIFILTDSFETY